MTNHPKHLPAEARRAATVEAVIQLAADQNPAEITTTAIARQMGLTQGALFRHFPNKDSILEATMHWVSDRLLRRLDKAATGHDSPCSAIEAMFKTHIDFVAKHPGVPRMLFGELQRAEETLPKKMAKTLLDQYADRLRVLLNKGKQAGEFSNELDIDSAIMLYLGMTQGLIMQSLLSGRVAEIRQAAIGAFEIYLNGIRART